MFHISLEVLTVLCCSTVTEYSVSTWGSTLSITCLCEQRRHPLPSGMRETNCNIKVCTGTNTITASTRVFYSIVHTVISAVFVPQAVGLIPTEDSKTLRAQGESEERTTQTCKWNSCWRDDQWGTTSRVTGKGSPTTPKELWSRVLQVLCMNTAYLNAKRAYSSFWWSVVFFVLRVVKCYHMLVNMVAETTCSQ